MALRELSRAIWRIGSGRPRVMILGGVHGNERTGVEVVRRLVDRLGGGGFEANKFRGELTLALGHPEAIERNVRFLDEDLNRCFGERGEEESSAGAPRSRESQRASELADHLRELDVLVDLHATNKPSAPFVRLPGLVDLAYFERCERVFLSALPSTCSSVLWDPLGLIAQGCMADEFALRNSAGKVYLCYESGMAADVGAVPGVAAAVDHLLAATATWPESFASEVATPREWSHFEVFEVVTLDSPSFGWLGGHGAENFQAIARGEAYGRTADGRLVEALWQVGKPLGWQLSLLLLCGKLGSRWVGWPGEHHPSARLGRELTSRVGQNSV
ncbi:unnamed protein product [Polarella glacialis]|uniref:Succinylglutamate desuccinylase/Aspartoacylase catalytic domain-containing protein n=1 Tax=Polarella glacialis TaxID=89957 RepID=A0A813G2F0_POLGL|nr:unnamed protein product [Polarella glacialis]